MRARRGTGFLTVYKDDTRDLSNYKQVPGETLSVRTCLGSICPGTGRENKYRPQSLTLRSLGGHPSAFSLQNPRADRLYVCGPAVKISMDRNESASRNRDHHYVRAVSRCSAGLLMPLGPMDPWRPCSQWHDWLHDTNQAIAYF